MSQGLSNGAILGPYEIRHLIGSGGMGEVYRGWNTGLMRDEAIKVLPTLYRADPEIVSRFLNDARTAAALRHPNIVTIFSVANAGDQIVYFSMELIDGEDLATYIERQGRLDVDEVVGLLKQLASALDYAHQQGVVHRDMKPANVLLAGTTAKVVDFGIARVLSSDTRLTQEGMLVGTARYMAPEQATGGAITAATDQYSLGIVAYELLCGNPPFVGKEGDSDFALLYAHTHQAPTPPYQVNPSIPRSTSDAILRALSKEPQKRFPNCEAFVEALGAVQKTPVRSEKRTSPYLAVGVAAIGAILIGAALMRPDRKADAKPFVPSFNGGGDTLAPPEKILLESWIGKKLEEAQSNLEDQGLEVKVEHLYDEANSGSIVKQTPVAGESVEPSATVTLFVSKGPKPAPPAVRASTPRTTYVPPPPDVSYLERSDIESKSRGELDVMRNTLYARRGYRFKRKDLQSYFGQFSWYRPVTSDMNSIYRSMSSVERHNVDLISGYERQMGWIK